MAVIFGAWLMQANEINEKKIILLTGNDSEKEANIEQQLRELTLLPLNIKHISVKTFLRNGAPERSADYYTLYHPFTALFAAADSYESDPDRTPTGADP